MSGVHVEFHGYSWWADTVEQAQSQLKTAERELSDGDIDAWFYAGRPTLSDTRRAAAAARKTKSGGSNGGRTPVGARCPCGCGMSLKRGLARHPRQARGAQPIEADTHRRIGKE